MFRKAVKTTEIEIEGQRYAAQYYEQKTARGSRRFSCEVTIDATDRITGVRSSVARRAPRHVVADNLTKSVVAEGIGHRA